MVRSEDKRSRTAGARRRARGRVLLLALLLAGLASLVPAGVAQAQTYTVTVSLQQSSLVVGGNMTAVTATVEDGGTPVAGDTVSLSVSPTTPPGGPPTVEPPTSGPTGANGQFSTQVASGDTAATYTITATEADTGAQGSTQLVQTAGTPTSVTVALSPTSSIPADGSSTTNATATVLDTYGNPVPGDTVTWTSTNSSSQPGGQSFNPVSEATDANGQATTQITSTTTPGTYTITATESMASVSGTATLVQTGPPATVTVTPTSSTIVANGTTSTQYTATVTDADGQPIPGDTVTFSANGDQAITQPSGPTDANGQATATVFSSTAAGTYTITASQSMNGVVGTAQLVQTAGPPAIVEVALSPTSTITANGTSSTHATATVTDQYGNPIQGDTVTLSASGAQTITQPAGPTDASGQTTGTITSSTVAGTYTITATESMNGAQGTAQLTQAAGPATALAVVVDPSTIVADGSSTTTAVATVTDQYGNPVPNETVTVSANGGQRIAQPAGPTNANGQAAATITSTTVLGTYTITATDATRNLSSQTQLVQSHGPAKTIGLSLNPATLVAGGSTGTADITLTDAQGRPVPGDDAPGAIVLTASDSGVSFGPVTDDGNGRYSATFTTSTVAHPVTITAYETGARIAAAQVLEQVHGPAHFITVQLSPPAITADGISSTTVTIHVTDADGNPVAGDHLTLTSTNSRVRTSGVTDLGNGVYSGTVTSSNMPATLSVIATDATVSPNVSGEATLAETLAPSLLTAASMQWSFFFSPSYTVVQSLTVSGAPVGGTIEVICHGRGCPFGRHTISVKRQRCRRGHRRHCQPTGSFNLTTALANHHLRIGAQLVVEVLRSGWVGKYYSFRMRARRGPRVTITCLAPGGTVPGLGCT